MPNVTLSPGGDRSIVSDLPANLQDIGTLTGVGVGVPATALFFDYFFSDNLGAPRDNLNAFIQWAVTGGSVDLIGGFGPGVFGAPPNEPTGRFVDLGGSTADPGFFQTRLAYPVIAGQTYTFAFDYRSTGGDLNRATASVGDLNFVVSSASPQFQHFSTSFVATVTTVVRIAFQGDEADRDGSGVGVDGVLFGPAQPGALVGGGGGGGGGGGVGGGGVGGGGSGGGGGAASPSVAAGLSIQLSNLIRSSANTTTAQDPSSPIGAQFAAGREIIRTYDAGQLSLAEAEDRLGDLVDGTTGVAVTTYAFFTGRTPTTAGLNFLVNSGGNATDLNDGYYTRFTAENRYINLAVSLGTGGGAGAAAFASSYGALSLADATATAYLAVFGATADAAKVDALLNTQVPNGLGGTMSRAAYFAASAGGPMESLGTKAAVAGFLLSNAVQTEGGVYGVAEDNYTQALAHGLVPSLDSEFVLTYGRATTLTGVAATADPSLFG